MARCGHDSGGCQVNGAEFRLKTGLLGFSPTSLNIIFDDLDGAALDVLNGRAPVPERVGQIVSAWWEEVVTAVENATVEAITAWETEGRAAQLVRYAHHDQLPREVGAHASSLQSWDYHLGLIIRSLERAGVPYEIATIED